MENNITLVLSLEDAKLVQEGLQCYARLLGDLRNKKSKAAKVLEICAVLGPVVREQEALIEQEQWIGAQEAALASIPERKAGMPLEARGSGV